VIGFPVIRHGQATDRGAITVQTEGRRTTGPGATTAYVTEYRFSSMHHFGTLALFEESGDARGPQVFSPRASGKRECV